MQKNLIRLLVSLSLISSSHAETTSNLVSQDFTTGWSGTNLNSTHGSTTIAGVNGQYVESDSISLNAANINKESINNGLTITGSANYWFWYGAQQSVTQTIKTVDDNGNTITQIRVVSGTSGSGTTYDQLIIGSNSQQDYNVSLRYDFSIPSQPNYHYAADLNSPSLTVDYTYVPPMDAATQTALLDLNKEIKDELKDVSSIEIKEEVKVISSTDTMTTETVKTDTVSTDTTKDQTSTTSLSETKDDQGATSVVSTSNQSETQEEKTENKEPESNTATTSENQEKESNPQGTQEKSEVASLNTTMDKIDANVKDIGKNLEMKNQALHSALIDNSLILSYQIPFYKERKIYENQIDIRDNRILYANTSLVSYTQNDPVYQKQKILYNIKIQKQKLLNEIQVLKNG